MTIQCSVSALLTYVIVGCLSPVISIIRHHMFHFLNHASGPSLCGFILGII